MATTAKFREVMKPIMFNEIGNTKNGGYNNHPNDRGKETKYGISKKYHPNVDVKNLTLTKANAIYYSEYWKKIRGDDLGLLAGTIMDFAVNSGVKKASRILQSLLGVRTDGIIGDRTILALKNVEQSTGLAPLFLLKYTNLRIKHYLDICRKDHSQDVFLYGWINRTEKWVTI